MDRLNSPFLSPHRSGEDDGADVAEASQSGAEACEALTQQERVARIVRAIEDDIIPRLVRSHQSRPAAPAETSAAPVIEKPTRAEVETLVALVLQSNEAGWTDLLKRLHARRVAVEAIYLDLLTPAARLLGEMWEDDRCLFTDVTVGVGHLLSIMRGLGTVFGGDLDAPSDGRRVLLVPSPGEQHTFGLSIVAEFFRRAGWDVTGGVGDHRLDPVALVRDEWFDVVGISVGIEARLDWLQTCITDLRKSSRNRGLGVMVGGPVFVKFPARAQQVGADATAVDGGHAPEVAELLLDSRAARV